MPYLGNTTTSFNVDSNNINNGSITTEKIAAGAVVNADVNDSASIAGTKISADFGAQNLVVDTSLLFVDATNDRVGIGTATTAASNPLTIRTASGSGLVFTKGVTSGFWNNEFVSIGIQNHSNDTNNKSEIRFGVPADGTSDLRFLTQASAGSVAEKMRLDPQGRLLLGISSGYAIFDNSTTNPKFQFRQTGGDPRGAAFIEERGDSTGFDLYIAKSRGGSGITIVNSGDTLGSIRFTGADGTNQVTGALISAFVNDGVGADDMPTSLFFSTNSGTTAPTERLRIANTGAFGLSGANYGTSGQVLTSQGGSAAPQWATVSAVTTTNVPNLSNPAVSDVTVTGIPASATNIVIALTNVSTASTGTPQLNLQMGNGSMSTADYYWTTGYNTAWQSGGAVSSIRLTSTDINSGANTFSGIIHISESNGRMAVTAQLGVKDSSLTMLLTGATWAGGGTIDRIRFWSGSGNFDNGRMSVHSW